MKPKVFPARYNPLPDHSLLYTKDLWTTSVATRHEYVKQRRRRGEDDNHCPADQFKRWGLQARLAILGCFPVSIMLHATFCAGPGNISPWTGRQARYIYTVCRGVSALLHRQLCTNCEVATSLGSHHPTPFPHQLSCHLAGILPRSLAVESSWSEGSFRSLLDLLSPDLLVPWLFWLLVAVSLALAT